MGLFKKLNVQTRIALIFSLVILLVIGGGIATFMILSNLAWALPGLKTAGKIGPELSGALASTRLTFTYIIFLEVLLLLPLGIGLIRTIGPRLKKDVQESSLHNTQNPAPCQVDEPIATLVIEEIGVLTNQVTEAARKANEVMAHSQTAIRKGIAMSEATLEALEENKKLTIKVTQLIEKIGVASAVQPECLH